MKRPDFAALAVLGAVGAGCMMLGSGLVRGCQAHAAPPPVIGALADHPATASSAGESPDPARLPITPDTLWRLVSDAAVARAATPEERRLIALADRCELAGPRRARPWVGLALLREEELAGVPVELRGVTLATWCSEAALGVGAEVCATGPCDGGRAKGPLQMHAGLARLCLGLPFYGPPTPAADALRDDPALSARCYLAHVLRVLPRASCRGLGRWTYAEAWIARGRRPVDCRDVSSHVRRLLRWRTR